MVNKWAEPVERGRGKGKNIKLSLRNQKMKADLYSIVVPVYRSEGSLVELYERIDKTFGAVDGDYELIFVEDCGGDQSWEVMKSLRKRDKRVKIARLTKNFGQHSALLCGFSFASGEYVITIDDDLQNPPEEIPTLIKAINGSDFDVVYGVPVKRKHSFIKNLGSLVNHGMVWLVFRWRAKLRMTNFRIIKKDMIQHILQFRSSNPSVNAFLLKITDTMSWVPVEHRKRVYGKTTYTKKKLFRQFLNNILYHNDLPLKFVFYLGIGILCLSFALGGYYLIRFFMGLTTLPGWLTIVLLILFFSGITMFSVGIIGEYLLRIIQDVRGNPQYIIRDREV